MLSFKPWLCDFDETRVLLIRCLEKCLCPIIEISVKEDKLVNNSCL